MAAERSSRHFKGVLDAPQFAHSLAYPAPNLQIRRLI